MDNLAAVQAIYESFGRGDIPAILDGLADDVRWDVWDSPSPAQDEIPYLVPRNGKDEVGRFFASLGDLEFHGFTPRNLLEAGGQVVALIDVDVTVKATGKRIQDLEVHVWTFGDDGKVASLRHVVDTAKHAAAQKP